MYTLKEKKIKKRKNPISIGERLYALAKKPECSKRQHVYGFQTTNNFFNVHNSITTGGGGATSKESQLNLQQQRTSTSQQYRQILTQEGIDMIKSKQERKESEAKVEALENRIKALQR